MKRMLVILLALVVLAACVPTPEEEYVIGKTLDRSESSEAVPGADALREALTSCQETVAIDKGALSKINFDAVLENMDVASAPIYPLTPVSFDAETVDRLVRALVPDARIAVGEGKMTLADIEQEIAATLNHINNVDTMTFESEADKAQYLAEEQEILSELQDAYRKAQGTQIAMTDAAALVTQEKVDFTLLDASDHAVAQGRITCGIEAGDPRSSLCHIWRTDDLSPELGEQDAEALQPLCEAFLRSAGIDGFAFGGSERRGDQMRQMYYSRTFPDLPYSAAYGITSLQWRDFGIGELFTEPGWSDEAICLLCKNGRVISVDWCSKSEIGSAGRDVSILSFEELKPKIINGLTYQWSIPYDKWEQSHRIVISRVQIGYKRVPVYGATGQYQLIPTCTVIGGIVQKYQTTEDAGQRILDENLEWFEEECVLLVLNATDGSIVG